MLEIGFGGVDFAEGTEGEATRNGTVGIYISGHDLRKVDTIEIEGTPHEVVDMRRMQIHGEAVTLLLEAREVI